MKLFTVGIFVSLLSFGAQAYDSADAFCKGINKEAKAKTKTTVHSAVISKMAKPLLGSKDCAFIKENYQKEGWALIDARDKSARKSTGTFAGVVKMTSDHHDDSKHKFKPDFMVKKFGKHFKGQKRGVASVGDLKEKNLILFCNGLTCYRSSWAACSLNKMGFSKDNLYVVLDGYDGLKGCLK